MGVSEILEKLDSPDLGTRWDAIVELARMPKHLQWGMVWNAIESRLDTESDEALRGQMAQALSMITSVNGPSNFTYDFLSTFAEYQAGIERPPSPQQWDELRGCAGGVADD